MKIGEHREALQARVRVLSRVCAVALVALGGAFWFVQVVEGEHYRQLADNNRLRRVPIEAPRGQILDRDGRVLVENLPAYHLTLDRSQGRDVDAALDFAAGVLGRPRAELDAVYARAAGTAAFQPVLLAENLSFAEVARFRVAELEHPELDVEAAHRRVYRLGAHGAHVLGYLGEVREEEIAAPASGLEAGDWIGRRGLERTYDRVLRGRDGERIVVVDSRGQPIEEQRRELGRPGAPIRLTIDAELQQEAERLMADHVGAIVALDPRDGAVRALVSAPAYDPNLFARRLAVEDWRRLADDPRHPLQNRALSSAFSPGSVFKMIVAAAGLSEGLIAPGHTVYCRGAAEHYGRRFHCWKRGGHGAMDLERALEQSCDVYFYDLGRKLGIDKIAAAARRFGIGEATGIDLEGERTGLVPDEAWSQRVRKHPWYPGETISVSIGQGALLTTPLQVAVFAAAIANGGFRVTPHLLADDPDVPAPVPTGFSPAVLAPVQRGLARVVANGTGGSARVPGLSMAGKTGTVQVISHEAWQDTATLPWEHRNHAWFASYAPVERPELVVVIFVEHGGMGSRAAAPLARVLHAQFFGIDLRAPAAS
jgi:penicillin-binding protein 2